jgi:hypothetical protein
MEEKTPKSLPSMVPQHTLLHAQRQLFCLELDMMARNPEKKKVVMPSSGQESALASTKRKMIVLEQELVEGVTELDSSPGDEEPDNTPNAALC